MRVEWIILADYAEVVNGKLYLVGGAWETLTVNTQFPNQHLCGVAVSLIVPWLETNHRHDVEIVITDEDEREELGRLEAQLEQGRPAGIKPGRDQRVVMAFNAVLPFKRPGDFVIRARAGEVESKTVFAVAAGPNTRYSPASAEGVQTD